MDDPRYPIGKYTPPAEISPSHIEGWIAEVESFPARFRSAVAPLTEAQLETPYRSGGWTIRQVVHHVADSHLNAYVRFKLALTEDVPTIKPYDEKRWANLPDTAVVPVEVSLHLLSALHTRWAALLRALSPTDFDRTFQHPEHGPMRLDRTLGMYVWHGNHHLAHIANTRF